MRTLSRYLAREAIVGTSLVFAALLMLFGFFDLIHELGDLGKGDYKLAQVATFVVLSLPGHIYELFPIAALIGTLFALSQLNAHSELTVMRVSGLPLWRIAIALLQVGLLFAALTFVFGEFIAPSAERFASQLRLKATKGVIAQEFRSGLWVKDASSFVNVEEVLPDSTLRGIKVYDFDEKFNLRTIGYAAQGVYAGDGTWKVSDVSLTLFEARRATIQHLDEFLWKSVLSPEILNVLLVVPEQMSAWNLYSYIHHLHDNKQKTTRYEIAFWAKLTYPLATVVMLVLALPFASYQLRSGGVSAKIFAGIMVGLSFHLLNRLFAHLGLLNDWPPLASAIIPTLVFMSLALAMIWWVERR